MRIVDCNWSTVMTSPTCCQAFQNPVRGGPEVACVCIGLEKGIGAMHVVDIYVCCILVRHVQCDLACRGAAAGHAAAGTDRVVAARSTFVTEQVSCGLFQARGAPGLLWHSCSLPSLVRSAPTVGVAFLPPLVHGSHAVMSVSQAQATHTQHECAMSTQASDIWAWPEAAPCLGVLHSYLLQPTSDGEV
jgi:hypothetical protein